MVGRPDARHNCRPVGYTGRLTNESGRPCSERRPLALARADAHNCRAQVGGPSVPQRGDRAMTTIKDLKGVVQLDKLDKDHALLLVQSDGGGLNLQAIALP